MRIQLDDICANVEVTGDGVPVVLLHGSFCNTMLWEPQQELDRSLKLIAVDIRGHGGTPCPVTTRSLNRPLDVIQILDSLDIGKAFFCGLSMGGPTAIQLALDYPERCLGVILLATGPGPGDRSISATQEMRDSAEGEARRVIELGPVGYFNASGTADAPGVREFLDVPEQREFFERMLARNNAEWLADWFRTGALDMPADLERLLTSRRIARMHELSQPLLFMVGTLDKTFLGVADWMKGLVPHSEIEVVPGATHLINVDSADVVNSTILRFVGRAIP